MKTPVGAGLVQLAKVGRPLGRAPCESRLFLRLFDGAVADGPLFFASVKYGKVPEEEQATVLPRVDFGLPEDHPDTAAGLATGLPGEGFEARAGGTMWTIRPWRGNVYPAKAPQRTWPTHYGAAFGTIELNATHYRIHPPERMAEWADAMPSDFRFCPKFPAIISHYRRFNDCEGPTDDFIAGLDALGGKRGPSFLQLPPQFSPRYADRLMASLQQWPRIRGRRGVPASGVVRRRGRSGGNMGVPQGAGHRIGHQRHRPAAGRGAHADDGALSVASFWWL